ncbi:unnamed protein product [Durusdinium trenchii]|uniref:PA14 domain-containing protein n=1 Tax=Durusdinium trenchii TaxID=1381693 RepID=A0ABP0R8X1_9DINO
MAKRAFRLVQLVVLLATARTGFADQPSAPRTAAVPVVQQHDTAPTMPRSVSPTVEPGVPVEHRPAAEAVPVVAQHTTVASMPEPASPTVQPAAVPVVPLPTSTVTFTTTPPVLRPVDVGAALEQGLVGELFDFKTKTSTVAVIDHTVHHWGDVYSALAIKWKGFLFIRKPGHYRFQITCLGAAELRIDGAILIKEDALMLARASIPSTTVTLPAGYHSILIGYTELEGQAGFAINYIGPDTEDELKLIPAHALLHVRGPCDLRPLVGLDHIACGTADRPRWALGHGESCEVRCSWGRFPSGVPGMSSLISCHEGQLSRPSFSCSPMRCSGPKASEGATNIGNPPCEEGSYVEHGSACTPHCAHGFGAMVSEPLHCDNGTLSGLFSCQAKRPCAPPQRHIVNGGTPSCLIGSSIPHGARCGAFCAHGFEPAEDPICQDGQLVPEVFTCRPLQPQMQTTSHQLQAEPIWYETTKPLAFLGAAGPPTSGLPVTLLISGVAAAILSAGACIFLSAVKKRQQKKRGLLLSDSRRSISTDYSGNSSDYRSNSDSGEEDLSPVSPVEEPEVQVPSRASVQLARQEELRERARQDRLAFEERERERYRQHVQQAEEKRRQEARQEPQPQPQPEQPKERILGSSYRTSVPAPKRAPASSRRYAEDLPPHWSDVRLGDQNPAKANRVPWSDVRIG